MPSLISSKGCIWNLWVVGFKLAATLVVIVIWSPAKIVASNTWSLVIPVCILDITDQFLLISCKSPAITVFILLIIFALNVSLAVYTPVVLS